MAALVEMLTCEGRSAVGNAQPETARTGAAQGGVVREDVGTGFPAGSGHRGPHVEPAGGLAEDGGGQSRGLGAGVTAGARDSGRVWVTCKGAFRSSRGMGPQAGERESRGQEWALGTGRSSGDGLRGEAPEALGKQRQGTEGEGGAEQSELCQRGGPWCRPFADVRGDERWAAEAWGFGARPARTCWKFRAAGSPGPEKMAAAAPGVPDELTLVPCSRSQAGMGARGRDVCAPVRLLARATRCTLPLNATRGFKGEVPVRERPGWYLVGGSGAGRWGRLRGPAGAGLVPATPRHADRPGARLAPGAGRGKAIGGWALEPQISTGAGCITEFWERLRGSS